MHLPGNSTSLAVVVKTRTRTTTATVVVPVTISFIYAPESETHSSSGWPAPASQATTLVDVLPSVVENSSDPTSPPVLGGEGTPTPSEVHTPSSSLGADANDAARQQAVIGGLCGSISGLALIGVAIYFLLRRQRDRRGSASSVSTIVEKSPRRRTVAGGWPRRLLESPHPVSDFASVRTHTHEPESQILQVRLDRWLRPFAHEAGYRESQGPTTLRVTNPDLSWPPTPSHRPSSLDAASFLRRQRGILSAVLAGAGASRSSTSSRADSERTHSWPRSEPAAARTATPSVRSTVSNRTLPVVTQQHSCSRAEPVAVRTATPSVCSAVSNLTLPAVTQQPPEDPFLTPPDERAEQWGPATPATRPVRPGVSPLQSAVQLANKTLGAVGGALSNPLGRRSRPSVRTVASSSGRSDATFSSRGDPFKLDRPSATATPRGDLYQVVDWGGKQGTSRVTVYSGT